MKLYWSPRSPFVRKVMVCAHELGIAARIDLIPVTVAFGRLDPAVMRDNPLNKIPTLITDAGEALFDSLVICAYLDAQHGGGRLFSAAGDDRWRAMRWHALGNGMLDLAILWRSERSRPEPQRAPELVGAFATKQAAALASLEQEADALGSAAFGIGQITVACALSYLDFRFPDIAWRHGRDRLGAWFEQVAQRSSMRATQPVDQP